MLPRDFLRKALLAGCALLFTLSTAQAQTCGAPGKDGPASLAGTLNTYYPANTGTYGPASTSLGVGTSRGATTALAPGDLALVIQMQCETLTTTDNANYGGNNGTGRGYTDPGPGGCAAGRYEYVRAGPATTAASLDLSSTPLAGTYVQDAAAATNRRTFQVVRVPQYASATLTGGITTVGWDGGTGGVIAIDVAGNLTLNGQTLNVAGQGFRGGGGAVWNNTAATTNSYVVTTNITTNVQSMKGEGIAGTPRLIYNPATNAVVDLGGTWGGYAGGDQGRGAPGNAGGGGGNFSATRDNGGGGGGGNGGVGGLGAYGWKDGNWGATYAGEVDLRGIGGATFAQASPGRVVMGGGGGAGGNNNSAAVTSSGGAGGGIVLVRTGSASGIGLINASGAAGQTQANNDSSGGGGAGGSVVFSSASGNVGALTVNVSGGVGGNGLLLGTPAHAGGGGGGGGVIYTSAGVTGNTAGGANGITNIGGLPPGGAAHGATAGAGGAATSPIAGTFGGVQAGADCRPAITVTKLTTTPLVTVPAGTTAQYRIVLANAATAAAAYGVGVSDPLPTPFGLATTATLATVTLSGIGTTGPSPTTANRSGTTATATFGVAGSANQATSPSFTLFPGGVVTLTFTVNLNTTTVATYQNGAVVSFTDPTRTTGGAATGAAVTNPTVSPGGTYANGGTVGGSNYAAGSSTQDDVRLINGATTLSIAKTNGVTSLASGQTTSYTLTIANLGPTAAPGAVVIDPAVPGLSCTSVACSATAANMCPAAPTVAALQSTGLQITPTFPVNSTASFVVTCSVTATGQ